MFDVVQAADTTLIRLTVHGPGWESSGPRRAVSAEGSLGALEIWGIKGARIDQVRRRARSMPARLNARLLILRGTDPPVCRGTCAAAARRCNEAPRHAPERGASRGFPMDRPDTFVRGFLAVWQMSQRSERDWRKSCGLR